MSEVKEQELLMDLNVPKDVKELAKYYIEELKKKDSWIGKLVFKNEADDAVGIEKFSELFTEINNTSENPFLAEDIVNAMLRFFDHRKDYTYKLKDCILVIGIARDCVESDCKDSHTRKDYWDKNGQYYKLRINEIPNTFLMMREQFELI